MTAAIIAASILLFGLVAALSWGAPATAAPVQQTVAPRSVTLYGPTAVTTGTTYSAAPLTVQNIDNSRVTNYEHIEVFAATDAGTTGSVVVTVQFSPDQFIWADATEIVHTFNTTGTLASNTYTLSKSLSGASQAGLIRAPISGEFVRVKVVATGAVTPTIKATLR
jgi:hypothetical protein